MAAPDDSAISHKIINTHAFIRVCVFTIVVVRRTAYAIHAIRKWCNFISSSKSKRHLGSEYICVGTFMLTMPANKKKKKHTQTVEPYIHCTRSIQNWCRLQSTQLNNILTPGSVHMKTIRIFRSTLFVRSIQYLCWQLAREIRRILVVIWRRNDRNNTYICRSGEMK